jgi:phage gpG-like protein
MKDWTPEFKKSGDYLQGFFSDQVFASEGAVFGEPWAPLSPAYAAQKARKYGSRGILVATGAMQKSFQTQFGSNYVRVFNTSPYFKYHQSNQPRSRLPRRIVMKLDENRKQQVVKIFRDGLQGQIKRAGIKSLYK